MSATWGYTATNGTFTFCIKINYKLRCMCVCVTELKNKQVVKIWL